MTTGKRLSFDQEMLWHRHQRNPHLPTFNVYSSVRLTGPLDAEAFEDAWNFIARRHEIWRTTYRVQDGQPVQVVSPFLTMRVPVTDLTDVPEEAREEAAMAGVIAESRTPVDLENGPVIRIKLFRLRAEEHVMTFVIHHLAHDRVSFTILFQELMEAYKSYAQGRAPRLAMPARQYGDYAEWQREWFQGEVRERMLGYWRDHLAGSELVLHLRTDKPRPPVQTFKGERVQFEIPAPLSAAYKSLAMEAGVTPFMFLLTVYYMLLHQEADGQEDVVIATPFANRARPEFERTLGYFLTSTVLRAQVRPGDAFRELLEQVRQVSVGAFDHQGTPYSLLIEELQAKADPSRNPIFQAMFVYLNHPDELQMQLYGGLQMEAFMYDGEISKYDLTLTFEERPAASTVGFLEFNPDLHERATAERMVERIQVMIRLLTEDADRTVGEYVQVHGGAALPAPATAPVPAPRAVLLFPGLGSQAVNMGRQLYQEQPVYRAVVDRCCEHLQPLLGVDLRDVMYREETARAKPDMRLLLRRSAEPDPLRETPLAHCSLFVTEYAWSTLLMEAGIQPRAMIGHSLGEYVAACLAGVFSLEAALTLVARRAQLSQQTPAGAMLAVGLGEEELTPLLGTDLHIATVNAPTHCLVSGTAEAVKALHSRLEKRDVLCYRLETETGFHSPMLQEMREPFAELVRSMQPQAPRLPLVSNVTGTWMTAEQATDPVYWVDHLCQPVRFADGLRTLLELEGAIWIEAGPGSTLTGFVQECAPDREVLAGMRHPFGRRTDHEFLEQVLRALHGHAAEEETR